MYSYSKTIVTAVYILNRDAGNMFLPYRERVFQVVSAKPFAFEL